MSRNLDPVTLGLRTVAINFLGAGAEVPFSLGRACIVLFGIWRVMAGTLPFALALGPLYSWSPLEKSRSQALVRLIWAKGKECVDLFFSNAYSAPRILRNGLLSASQTRMERIIRPSDAIKEAQPMYWQRNTVRGRLVSIDSLWEVSGKVFEAGRSECSRRMVSDCQVSLPKNWGRMCSMSQALSSLRWMM